jgi:ribosome-interacting GTPase 1
VTKCDEAAPFAHPELPVVAVSVLDDDSLARLRDAVWALTGLLRVELPDGEAVALRPPATVVDVARSVHTELAERCTGARVWGPSARFEGQRVGRGHVVADGDRVEVLA